MDQILLSLTLLNSWGTSTGYDRHRPAREWGSKRGLGTEPQNLQYVGTPQPLPTMRRWWQCSRPVPKPRSEGCVVQIFLATLSVSVYAHNRRLESLWQKVRTELWLLCGLHSPDTEVLSRPSPTSPMWTGRGSRNCRAPASLPSAAAWCSGDATPITMFCGELVYLDVLCWMTKCH